MDLQRWKEFFPREDLRLFLEEAIPQISPSNSSMLCFFALKRFLIHLKLHG